MQTYISILRGINVSGHKMIKMDQLKNLYQKLNFKNVQTYIQSGNVIFQFDKTETIQLEKQIAGQVNTIFGFEVPVLVLTAEKLKDIFNHNPYLVERTEDITRLHITFLSGLPEKSNMDKIVEGDYGNDEYFIKGNVIYLFCPHGYGTTKLNNNYFESKLKLTATTRNWKTVTELMRIADEI